MPDSSTSPTRRRVSPALLAPLLVVAILCGPSDTASAQETGQQQEALRAAALRALPATAARRLFGLQRTPAPGPPRAIGQYWKGCLVGGVQLPPVGEHWQVMRLSRGRNWGHPRLISFLKKFSRKASQVTGWPGILIGDLSQPRGGPMLTGHNSHQLGIEADIWLRPKPSRTFEGSRLDGILSTEIVRPDGRDVDPDAYTPRHLALIKAAASEPGVARIFVNAAIKKALCRDAGADRAWLRKIRLAGGHSYHFHIRLDCGDDEPGCVPQPPPGPGDGCGAEVASWLPSPPLKSPIPGASVGRVLPLSALPATCRDLVPVRRPAN